MDSKVNEALLFIGSQLDEYNGNIPVLNSFGKDSLVVLHLVRRLHPEVEVWWIKPPFLPESTLIFADRVTKKWKLNLKVYESAHVQSSTWMQDIVYKPKLWLTNPELCCQVFKVQPSMDAVKERGVKAWFSGMRNTESEKRGMYTKIWKQGPNAVIKLHPIIDFTEADVWRYIACNKLPVHPWYELGYRSLGCAQCSFPNTWNSERGGRWKNTMMEGGDCGVHCTPMMCEIPKEE